MNEDIITLTDDDGNECHFELLDFVGYQEETYAVLLPADDEDSEEVVILRVEQDNDDPDNETLCSVDDDATLEAVFKIFMERMEEEMADEEE